MAERGTPLYAYVIAVWVVIVSAPTDADTPRGLRRPTRLVDLAEHAGVSTKTVSRVLNGEAYVAPAMRAKVMAAVDELSYVGDAAATGLRTKRSGFIGLIIPDVRNGFFALLTRAIEERLAPTSPTLLLVAHHGLSQVALLAGNTAVSNVRDRQSGYTRVMNAAGLDLHVSAGHTTPDDAAAGALELFSTLTPPFGVFTTNNRMFWGAMAAIARLGLHIPRDVLVTTIDSIGEATVTGLKPTQGVIPVQTVAAKAMKLLAERTEDPTLPPRNVSVDIDIEFGTTCGCIPLTRAPLMMGPLAAP